MTTTVDREPVNTIKVDVFDREDIAVARSSIPRLGEIETEMEAIAPAAADSVADTYAITAKAIPRVQDDVPVTHRLNQLVARQLLDADRVRDLREMTVGSPVQAALGTISLSETLADTHRKVREQVEREQEAAERAQQRLEQMLERARQAQENGTPDDAPSGDEVADAEADAQSTSDQLDDALGQCVPAVGRACRAAAAAAAESAESTAEAMAGWDLSPGEWASMPAAEFLALAERLRTPQLEAILSILGALKHLTYGARQEQFSRLPSEIHDIEQGNDLARILPTEYTGLVVPGLRRDWMIRFAEGRLLQYKMRSTEKVGRGGLHVLEDTSGSMHGEPLYWAHALGLAILDVARDDDRQASIIQFTGRGSIKEWDFPDRESHSLERRLAYAESTASGGTDVVGPINRAVDKLRAEYNETGRCGGDILVITDGIFSYGDDWLATLKADQETMKFRIYGIEIIALYGMHRVNAALDALCDGRVVNVTDLHSGEDVRSILASIQ